MPLVDREILEWVDGLLQCAGGVCTAAFIVAAVRGRLRDPLFLLAEPSPQGPRVEHLGLLLVHFMLPGLVVLTVLGSAARLAPGAHDWHVAHLLTGLAALLVAGCVAVVLRQRPSFQPVATAAPARTRVAGVASSVLIAFFLCFPQLKAAQEIGRAAFHATTQPTHAVLEAIQNSAWGGWGAVQLFASAVIVAPITEELLIRGLLLGVLWHYTRLAWFSILASSLFFGFMHYTQPQDVAPLVTFGIILGVVRFRTRSLVACIAVHSLFNFRTMAFVLLNPDMARTAN